MAKPVGTLIASYGIGGPIWSGGLKHIVKEAQGIGYSAATRFWWQGSTSGAKERRIVPRRGPLVIAGHSAGASFINAFSEAYGRPIDLAIFVDAWLPFMHPHKLIRRSVSVTAERFGRFAVAGPGVVSQVTIPDTTHTTVDDSSQLRALFRAELEALL